MKNSVVRAIIGVIFISTGLCILLGASLFVVTTAIDDSLAARPVYLTDVVQLQTNLLPIVAELSSAHAAYPEPVDPSGAAHAAYPGPDYPVAPAQGAYPGAADLAAQAQAGQPEPVDLLALALAQTQAAALTPTPAPPALLTAFANLAQAASSTASAASASAPSNPSPSTITEPVLPADNNPPAVSTPNSPAELPSATPTPDAFPASANTPGAKDASAGLPGTPADGGSPTPHWPALPSPQPAAPAPTPQPAPAQASYSRPDPVVRLVIPKLKVKRAVVDIGAGNPNNGDLGWDTDRLFDTQNRPDLVGHLEGSANPGESGNIVLVGHNFTYTGNGVFVNLQKLAVGDQIKVLTESGQELIYQVTKVKAVPFSGGDNDLERHLRFLAPTPAEQLTLVTCGGANIGFFNKRVYVVAEPVN